MKKLKLLSLIMLLCTNSFVGCINPHPSQTIGEKQSSAIEKEEAIISFICSQYRSHYQGFEFIRMQSFYKMGDGYYAIIKFTYIKNGVKMFAVNNVSTDKDGYLKEVSYSASLPYDELLIDP